MTTSKYILLASLQGSLNVEGIFLKRQKIKPHKYTRHLPSWFFVEIASE